MLEELRASTRESQLDRLDTAIMGCLRVNLQSGDIEAAKRKLVQLCEEEVQKYLDVEKLADLRETLDKITNTSVGELVEKETWFQSARDLCEEIDVFKRDNERVQSVTEEELEDLEGIFTADLHLGDNQKELNDQELWEFEDWYPPLCPPTRRKNEILRDEDFRNVDSRARRALDSFKQSFKKLIGYLTKDLHSDLHKLRAIFMWMGAVEVGTREVQENCTDVDSPQYYLKETFSDRYFIARLFAKLCRGADIPCVLVNGSVKDAPYEAGQDTIGASNTWAVVYVDGSWRFVFPYGAFVTISGHQKGNWMLVEHSGQPLRQRLTEDAGIRISSVNEFWFLTDPDAMNCFCHPYDDDKQLLTHTWTEQEFYSLPYYQADYFLSGWNLLSPTKCTIKANSGLCEIEFQPPTPNGYLEYRLLFNEKHSGSPFPENIQTERYVSSCKKDGGQRVFLQIRLPVNGIYNIEVYCVHGSESYTLVKFRIDCDSVQRDTLPFPSQPKIGFGYGETALRAGLSEPSQREGLVPVRPGQEIYFRFKVQKDVYISARLVHATRPPEELRDNVKIHKEETSVTVTVRLPGDDPSPEYSLEVDTTQIEKGTYKLIKKCLSVLKYLLTSDKAPIENTMDKIKERKLQSSKNVYDALAKDDATLFEEAVFDFNTAGHPDPILFEKIEARKAKYNEMLEELRASTRERQLDRLNTAIIGCLRVNLQSGDIEASKRTLVQLCEEEVQKSLDEEKLTDLREILDKITNTSVGELVKKETWFQNARDLCEEIDIFKRDNERVQSMLEEETADLRNPEKVLDVIFSTVVLLGDSQEELNTWQQICRKMYKLLTKTESFEERGLTQDQVEAAAERLDRHDWTSDDGTVAKRLYTWCRDRIKLLQQRPTA